MIIAQIPFPEIDPVAVSVTLFGLTLALRWYALAYIAGILLGWFIAVRAVARASLWPGGQAPLSRAQVEDLLFWVILGIVLGGRLGFVLFYQPGYYLSNPAEIPMIWRGGMAFHGGLLGVVVAVVLFSRRAGAPLLSVADMLAVAVPMGIFFGRIANFINAELWGRPWDGPWAVTFPSLCIDPVRQGCAEVGAWVYTGSEVPRHPSQLYEAGLEGLLLGAVLIWLAWGRGALKRPGLVAGVFFAGYGAARFVVEHFREADAQFISVDNPLGHVLALGPAGVSMGQVLSLPMLVLGLGLIWLARRRGA